MRRLRVGLLGLGAGAADLLQAAADISIAEFVAGADPEAVQRKNFGEIYPAARTYATAEELCRDPAVEVVWVATPNHLHADHTVLAARNGKHVVVEKPMALTLDEAERMIEAAEDNGVKLLAGHTPSFMLALRAMRKIIRSGDIGALRTSTLIAYSDWLLRPRTADELDRAQGGGVPYRQGPHQVDIVRFLGGGMLRSVRGMTGGWMAGRPIDGYFGAYLEFEDGTPALISHNANGYFMANELVPWGEDRIFYSAAERAHIRNALRSGTRSDERDKQGLRIGGERGQTATEFYASWVPGDIGFLVASCERGDLRQSQHGILLHTDAGKHDLDLRGFGPTRRGELDELYHALIDGAPLCHDGRWGLANLEVCLALIDSARERKEIYLRHQTPIAAEYDAHLALPDYRASGFP